MGLIHELQKRLMLDYFEVETNEELSPDEKVQKLIGITCVTCAGVAGTTIPVADFFVLTPIQGYMGFKIAKVRGVDVTRESATEIAKEILGVLGLGLLARQIAITTLKFVPFFGYVASMPVVYALTYAIGKVMDYYFKERAAGRTATEAGMRAVFDEASDVGERAGEVWAKAQERMKVQEKEVTESFLRARDKFVKDARAAFEANYKQVVDAVRVWERKHKDAGDGGDQKTRREEGAAEKETGGAKESGSEEKKLPNRKREARDPARRFSLSHGLPMLRRRGRIRPPAGRYAVMTEVDPKTLRLQKRVAKNLLAKVQAGAFQFFGHVNDLAKTGLGMSCNRSLQVGQELEFDLNVPTEKTMKMKGTVVWCRDLPSISKNRYLVGVRLTDRPEHYESFVERLLRREYERREHTRFTDVLEISSDDVMDLIDAATLDVSAGGLYVRTGRPLEVGRQFEMSLKSASLETPLMCLVEVIASFECGEDDLDHPYGAGVRIISFVGEDETRFGDYIRSLEKLYRFHWPEELKELQAQAAAKAAPPSPAASPAAPPPNAGDEIGEIEIEIED
ncbi:MAG: PilZ domain-containing protein [Deltaproteobacteria bacterium]|nr:PilZ domain-containing protein [Deltaproteobacteria bacterium]